MAAFGSNVRSVLTVLARNMRWVGISIRFWWTGYMAKWRYFSDTEVEGLDSEFVAKLDMARHEAGIPFVITSGKRTAGENERVMGVDASSHLKGIAVDLRSPDSTTRFRIVKSLLDQGITRIGVYDAHIHVDTDPDKPHEVMWIGVSH